MLDAITGCLSYLILICKTYECYNQKDLGNILNLVVFQNFPQMQFRQTNVKNGLPKMGAKKNQILARNSVFKDSYMKN